MRWIGFTKRTDDPKLAWLECQLLLRGIPSRRRGFSFHAPILEIPEEFEERAWEILSPIDDVEDDDPMFAEMEDCPPALARDLLSAGSRHEDEHMQQLSRRLAKHRSK